MSAAGQPPPSRRFADLRTRILSAAAAAAAGITLLYLGGYWTVALVAVACGAMAWEWRSVTLHGGGPCSVSAVPMVGAVAAGVAAYIWSVQMGFAVLSLGLAVAAVIDLAANRRAAAGWSLLGGLYLGGAGLALLSLRFGVDHGFRTALWLLVAVAAADIGGYFAGRMIGGPKLWPRVSPKKTWAGSVGGVTLAVLSGALFGWAFIPATGVATICAASAGVAVVSQAGDLAESALKRHFDVKDAGNILPGHGGALDRFDGLIAAAIAVGLVTWLRGDWVFIW